MKRALPVLWGVLALGIFASAYAQTPPPTPLSPEVVNGFEMRSLGPSLVTGRIADVAINPQNRNIWYVAVASGGLWKTVNHGATFQPIFDQYVSYSLGCVTVDPKNPEVVWLGTGENVSTRSCGFGDGVYKSTDGGKTWVNTGLKQSEHIGKIIIDPRNSDVVFVAAQGPLWAAGGDRGLYKTTDGGKSWKQVIKISEDTGVSDVAFETGNPDVLYASSWQRRRNTGMLIGGGPESAMFKSVDGGETWKKLTKGFPTADLGRIAIAVSPQQPKTVYAQIYAGKKDGGFYKSTDGGENWVKQSPASSGEGMYYGELTCDPAKFDKIYSVDTVMRFTEDGGKTFKGVRWPIHVDYHSINLDPTDPDHIITGNDGGLYESWDNGATFRHFTNLPVTQFYRIAIDNAEPFYNVYGGSQDNGTIGGPSRTRARVGIRTSDWVTVGGGDGFQARVDPRDPNTLYTQSQFGALGRSDLRTDIDKYVQPKAAKGEKLRWPFDARFSISPHGNKRLFLCAQRIFQSEDGGENWTGISPDLTRNRDRNKLPIMGKIWPDDAVAKNVSTTDLGLITAIDESPKKKGLIYAGTDDGLIQVTEDNGKTWRKVENIPGVPEFCTVSEVRASRHDVNVVYATLHNYQFGDFKPYALKSTDKGKTWTSITSNLPERGFLWCIADDPVNRNLLFVGSEFGLFVSVDCGQNWTQMKNGLPPIPVRNIEIQERDRDLVIGTFGRGAYVLDDLSALRAINAEKLGKEGVMLPVRDTPLVYLLGYITAANGNVTTPNPPQGVTLTYYLKQALPKDGKVTIIITDRDGLKVREMEAPGTAGIHRVTWSLRPASAGKNEKPRKTVGGMVEPGRFKATLYKPGDKDNVLLDGPIEFNVQRPRAETRR